MTLPTDKLYDLHYGDCIRHMQEMEPQSMDLLVSSPPFPSTFSYTDSPADVGNSEDLEAEAPIHLGFWFSGVRRVMKPGRAVLVHVCQIGRLKRSGGEGIFDFRGLVIRLGERAGLTYEYDWVIRKNPQAQALRTKKWELKFQGLETDRARSRGAMPDYLIKFIAPGENRVPVTSKDEVNRNDWIEWAECCWNDGIRETDVLNASKKRAKDEDDTKHIAPLQLGLIERCIRLYTNPGEIVFDPFAGICSTGFVAIGGVSPVTKRSIKNQRRFYGCELKKEYYEEGLRNLDLAKRQFESGNKTLFDAIGTHS